MAVIDQALGDLFALYHGDCMEILPGLPAESVGFTLWSPAFPETFAYSNDPRDLANCVSYEEGLEHLGHVVRECFRLSKPGRLCAVHCMDLKDGSFYQHDYPGDIVRLHQQAGFKFWCRVVIWKDPWLVARRTRMKALRHKNLVEDSTTCRVAGGDYVLVFKRPGRAKEPVRHPLGLREYAGSREIPADLAEQYRDFTGDQRTNKLSHWIWRRYASQVWDDIRTGRLLPYKETKESPEEKHVCPLQLDVVERCLTLWSNPGDTVLTPALGVGSEVWGAVRNGRRGVGVELKASYFRQAVASVTEAAEAFAKGERGTAWPAGLGDPSDPDEAA